MKVVLFLAHPDENSFCHAIAQRAIMELKKNTIQIIQYDLYRIHFDPVLTKEEYIRKDALDDTVSYITADIEESDCMIFIHPDWWGQPPAILKGLIDRVFRRGVAFDFEGDEFERMRQVPLMGNKRALVFCTTDSSDECHIGLLKSVWKNGVFEFCGIRCRNIEVFSAVRTSSYVDRSDWLKLVEIRCMELLEKSQELHE